MTTIRHVNRRGLLALRDLFRRRVMRLDIETDLSPGEEVREWIVRLLVADEDARGLDVYQPLDTGPYVISGLAPFAWVALKVDASSRDNAERVAERMAERVKVLPIYSEAMPSRPEAIA